MMLVLSPTNRLKVLSATLLVCCLTLMSTVAVPTDPRAALRLSLPRGFPPCHRPCVLSMDGTNSSSGSRGPWLPAALQLHVFSLLPPNDRALNCRLVSPDAAAGLSGPENCTASLSKPLPPHALAWALEAGQQHVRQLPFRHKLQLMCTAAASGSEVNLEVALALLQPSIFPELLQSYDEVRSRLGGDYCPGYAAAKAGHLQLLAWLVRRCPGLLFPGLTLKGAAQHCDLAGLQVAWEALQDGFGNSSECSGLRPVLIQDVLDAAAESATPDAVAKMEWVLRTVVNGDGGGRAEGEPYRLQLSTAAAAARTGDLVRLRWLRDQGCPMGYGPEELWGEPDVLEAALQHADLAVAQWLVDEAGNELPVAGGGDMAAEERNRAWTYLLKVAAEGPGAVAKWQWLQERGGPSVAGAEPGLVEELTLTAVEAGQVEAVQYLLSVLGLGKVLAVGRHALSDAVGRAGNIPLAECLQQAGLVLSHAAYRTTTYGSATGNLAFIRWLALEAEVSALAYPSKELHALIDSWPCDTPAHSRDLLEAVQLLAGAGFCDWDRDHAGFIVSTAAARGDLDLFRYLREEGARVDPEMYLVADAADAGCEPLLESLTAQPDCYKPSAEFGHTPYIKAAVNGDRATLDALRRLGVPWGEEGVVAEAVKNRCREPVLRWLMEHGAPVGSEEDMEESVAGALRLGSLGAEAAAWLRGLAAGGSGAGVRIKREKPCEVSGKHGNGNAGGAGVSNGEE